MSAPERFAEWLSTNRQFDKWGNEYRYHPRSDSHSIALCKLVLADLLAVCPTLVEQARRKQVAYGINLPYRWAGSGKEKTIDLALGTPAEPIVVPVDPAGGIARVDRLADVRLSLEAKSCMTEHSKSKPRLFDELSSSHEIVHKGNDRAVAAGITVVNISDTFVSPLRQHGLGFEYVTTHRQPAAAASMVAHLRGLKMRDRVGEQGLDAYSSFVISCDNQGPATLWTDPPAPQAGDAHYYPLFLDRLCRSYTERYRS